MHILILGLIGRGWGGWRQPRDQAEAEAREQVATRRQAVELPRQRTVPGLNGHTGLRVREAVRSERRDRPGTHTDHPRLHVRCGKKGKDQCVPLFLALVEELRPWWKTNRQRPLRFSGPTTAGRESG